MCGPETGHLGGQIDTYQSHWNNKCFLVLQVTNGHNTSSCYVSFHIMLIKAIIINNQIHMCTIIPLYHK